MFHLDDNWSIIGNMKKILPLLLIALIAFPLFAEEGIASWYTADKPNALTANGEVFDNLKLTAAHKSLTFGSIVKVTNLDNGKSIEVRINDRGPYVDGRVIDLTPEGARQLDFYKQGIAHVDLEVLSEPEKPETKYVSGANTGWYTLQVGTYTNIKNANEIYKNIKSLGLKPTVEIINDTMIRLSVANIQTYKLEETKAKLAEIGITEPLVKGAQNPYL